MKGELLPGSHQRLDEDSPLVLGIPNNGRLLEEATALINSAWSVTIEGRQLVHPVSTSVRIVQARSSDLPALLNSGHIDAAVTGSDYLAEADVRSVATQRLGVQKNTIVALTRNGDAFASRARVVVVSQYPRIAQNFLATTGWNWSLTAIDGAAEMFVNQGFADLAIDNYMTGQTAEANGLTVVASVMDVEGVLAWRSQRAYEHIVRPLSVRMGALA